MNRKGAVRGDVGTSKACSEMSMFINVSCFLGFLMASGLNAY